MEAVIGAMADVSPEARLLVKRLGGGEGSISSRGQWCINLYYEHPGQGGRHTPAVAEADSKRKLA